MQTIPTNVGATIRRTLPNRPAGDQTIHYVRDDHGVWHYWNFSGRSISIPNDEEMQEKTEEPGEFEVVSEGYVPPVQEPTGIGAVVVVDSGFGVETRYVRTDDVVDADSWVMSDDEIWVNWDHIAEQNSVRILSEGV